MNSNDAVFDCIIRKRKTTMDTKALRQKILDLAIHGKLVPQDPNDEPASVLLERIKAEKERLIKEGKIKRSKKSAKTSDTPHYENVPFEVPESWVWTTIDELCDVVRGGSPRPAGDEKYYNGAIPFLKVADLTKDDGIYVYKAEYTIKEAGLKKTRLVNEGTLLLTNSGATLGVPKITTFPTTFNDGIAAFLYMNREVQLYLYWFIKSKTDSLRKIDQGAAQPNLNTDLIKSIPIPLPPLTEQFRIIKEIEHWFALIDQIEQDKADLQTIIKQTKSKILDLAIHGKLVPQAPNDEPAIELLKRINPDFTPCDNGHYTQLPNGWEVVPMQMLCSLTDGEKLDGKEMPNLDVKYLRGERDLKTLTYGRYVAANSLLILVDGENSGEVFRTPIEGYQGSTFKQLHIAQNVHTDYLLHVINLHRKSLRENKIGSAIPHLNKKQFKAIEVPVPPYNEQEKIVAAINIAQDKLDTIMESL